MRENLSAWWLGVVTQFPLSPNSLAFRLVGGESYWPGSPHRWSGALGTSLAMGKSLKSALGLWRRYGSWTKKRQVNNSLREGGLIIFDYLAHIPREINIEKYFSSGYWGAVVSHLDEAEAPVTFVHIHYPTGKYKDLEAAQNQLEVWNFNRSGRQHLLLQSLLSPLIYFRSLRDYVKLTLAGCFMSRMVRGSDDGKNFLKVARCDWIQSFYGAGALQAVFFMNLVEALLSNIPKQRIGLYLQEGQPWEFALIAAWRRQGHGTLIGVPHSTIRYWDLRYARDPRTYLDTSDAAMPRPDFVAVNGPQARAQMLADGYPPGELVDVEALRYMHLVETRDRSSSSHSTQPARILLLGEYYDTSTLLLLETTADATRQLAFDVNLSIRSHPAAPKNPNFASRNMTVVDDLAVAEAVSQADVVVAMSTTSAVLDAYCGGTPVIVIDDPATLNGSPLLGRDDVPFVRTPTELASAIRAVLQDPPPREFRGDEFFFLDPELPRWRALLGLD